MNPVIYWFRHDLRLSDLPGLLAAVKNDTPVIPCYILDDGAAGRWAPGGASRWWLHHSLDSLSDAIAERGGELLIYAGDTLDILRYLAERTNAAAIHCSRSYEPWAASLERRVYEAFENSDCELKRFPGRLLFEPEQIANQSGKPFKVYTPFWKACRRQSTPGEPAGAPGKGVFADLPAPRPDAASARSLDGLELLPKNPNWAEGWDKLWQPGEDGARARIADFTAHGLAHYGEGRDHPAMEVTSRLSPHLHFGEVSPRQVWHAADGSDQPRKEIDKFLSELGWREFSYHLLHHFPHIPEKAFKEQFDDFPWVGKREHLSAWQRGRTGYPIVDAGMRQLWQTGYMHNRVRMIVASFLTKHLLLPWQSGENWFWDTLVDADLANNACGWQWVAGSGADASPYFRIFNPTAQAEKFDKSGSYVRRWVPELACLPDKYLHEPWTAPQELLEEAGVELGRDYPERLVEHRPARQAALDAYEEVRKAG